MLIKIYLITFNKTIYFTFTYFVCYDEIATLEMKLNWKQIKILTTVIAV